MQENYKMKGDTLKVYSKEGYTYSNRLLAKITDTGNGFIFKSKSWISTEQDNYLCMDYTEAELLLNMLKHFKFLENKNDSKSC